MYLQTCLNPKDAFIALPFVLAAVHTEQMVFRFMSVIKEAMGSTLLCGISWVEESQLNSAQTLGTASVFRKSLDAECVIEQGGLLGHLAIPIGYIGSAMGPNGKGGMPEWKGEEQE